MKALFDAVKAAFGRLDVVVNNAGINVAAAPIADTSEADFDRVMQVNTKGVFLVMREADGTARVEHDRHLEGLFTRAQWLEALAAEGLEPRALPLTISEVEPGRHEVFVGVKRP